MASLEHAKSEKAGAHDTLIGVDFDVEKLIVGMLFHAQFRRDQSIGRYPNYRKIYTIHLIIINFHGLWAILC